jgi:nucleotide-binding universal stress UspA family protein
VGEILVGVDGSANSAEALRWAVEEADLRDHHVTALFAWGYVPPGHAGDGHTFDVDYGAADADAALAAAIEAAVDPGAARTITRRVVYDTAARSLLSAARDADLLVIGARGVGGFRGLLLGSVSQQCLHHTTGPLAIIRTSESGSDSVDVDDSASGPARGRIVVGIDGSNSSRRALRWALEEGRLRGATVDVVHAWQPPLIVPSPFVGVPLDTTVVEKYARSVLDKVVDEATGHGGTPVERILVQGGAASAVLDTAHGAAVVVLGSRGRGGFTGLVLGSVTHHVAHHVRCPLVITP